MRCSSSLSSVAAALLVSACGQSVGPADADVQHSAMDATMDFADSTRDTIDATPDVITDVPRDQLLCDGRCVPSDVDHCGPSCMPCMRPMGGSVACVDGACMASCPPGNVSTGVACEPAMAPRPVHPMTNSRMTVRNPTLRWSLPHGVDAAHVRVCADRACSQIELEFDATGESARVPRELPAGHWFWNLRASVGGGASPLVSPTWMFHTPATSSPVESAWVSRPDLNGDGFDDIVISGDYRDPSTAAYVYTGNAAGVLGAACAVPAAGGGHIPLHAGDVDGDGFTDFLIATGYPSIDHFTLWRGNASGCTFTTLQTLTASSAMEPQPVAFNESAGDIDGDGYADVIGYSNGLAWARGSATGWGVFERIGTSSASAWPAVADLDGDGFDDVVTATASESQWWRGTSTGPVGPTSLGLSLQRWRLLNVGDIDGDGYLDIVEVGTNGSPAYEIDAQLVRGGPTGPHAEPPQRIIPIDASAGAADFLGTVGDLDADGRLDLAVRWMIWHDHFDAIFGTASGYSDVTARRVDIPCVTDLLGGQEVSATRSIGDWDGDGLFDSVALCVGSPTNAAWLLRSTPGALPTPIAMPTPTTGIGFGWFVM